MSMDVDANKKGYVELNTSLFISKAGRRTTVMNLGVGKELLEAISFLKMRVLR